MDAVKRIMRFLDRRMIAFSHDMAMVFIAWIGAYAVRQNFKFLPISFFKEAFLLLPAVIAIQFGFFVMLGLYRSVWRFASLRDLIQIIKAVFLGVITLIFYSYFCTGIVIPRTIPLLYATFLAILLCFGRLSVRWYKDRKYFFPKHSTRRVLIIGSGEIAETLIREMLRDAQSLYCPVAIVDSDPSTRNREIHRIRVLGNCKKIASIVAQYKVDMIFIALTQASSKEMHFILEECAAAKIPYRIISSFANIAQEGRLLSSLREVNVDDLLGRETYQVDMRVFYECIHNKRVLVTGGGGSIGSELCRQIASLNPAELLIIDQSEANLYHIQLELQQRFPQLALTVGLIDILHMSFLELFFKMHQPQLVFHAAAYKHVPLLERQVLVAVQNNIIGSKNVIDMAVKYHAETFVQISTDKAVNPTNVMGMTKRIAEIYSQHLQQVSKTKIMTVRFGNVLGSVGSVVPLFKAQLQQGGPLTVTHPDITRYFMTIPEACRLILQAMTMGTGGEIFVLDMGEPIKIKDLAEQMIRLSGKKVDDIKIVYTGLRAGEKLWEELFYSSEMMTQTKHKKIFQSKACSFDANFIQDRVSHIIRQYDKQDESGVFTTLLQLVPEYQRGSTKETKVPQPVVLV